MSGPLCRPQFHRYGSELGGTTAIPNDQVLHGRQIALSMNDPSLSLPPVDVFNWHYIQCVLKNSPPLPIKKLPTFTISPCRFVQETMTIRVTLTSTTKEILQILLILLTFGILLRQERISFGGGRARS